MNKLILLLFLITFPLFSFSHASAEESAEENVITFNTMYNNDNPVIHFSDKLKSLMNKEVVIRGYMAPPLKAEDVLMVLTKNPVAACLFCNSDAQWTRDIVVVYLKDLQDVVANTRLLEVRGTLELGSWRDPDTGFVSLVRIRDAYFEVVK